MDHAASAPRPEPGRAAAPPLPDGVTGLDPLWVQRRHRAGGVNHEYGPVVSVSAPTRASGLATSRRRTGQCLEEVSSEGMHRPSVLGRVRGGGRRCAGSRYSRLPSLS